MALLFSCITIFSCIFIANIAHADVPVVVLKGSDNVLIEKYQHLSPALGCLSANAGLPETLYRLAPLKDYEKIVGEKPKRSIDEPLYDLVQELFYLNNDGINFGYNQGTSNLGYYLTSFMIGQMVGWIEQKIIWKDDAPPKEFPNIDKSRNKIFRQCLRNSIKYQEANADRFGCNMPQIIFLSYLWKKGEGKQDLTDYFNGLASVLGQAIFALGKSVVVQPDMHLDEQRVDQQLPGQDNDVSASTKKRKRADDPAETEEPSAKKQKQNLYFDSWKKDTDIFTREDYEASKQVIQDAINATILPDLPISEIALVHQGRGLRTLSYRNDTKYKGKSFADCGETALRNFFNALFYSAETNKFDRVADIESTGFVLSDTVKQFYVAYSNQDSHQTKDAYDDWAVVVSGLADIKYVYDKDTYEIDCLDPEIQGPQILSPLGGFKNICALIRKLVTFSDTNPAPGQDTLEENVIKVLISAAYGKEDMYASVEKNNEITLTLQKYTWKFTSGHFEFEAAENNKHINADFSNIQKAFFTQNPLSQQSFAYRVFAMSLIKENYEKISDVQNTFSLLDALLLSPAFILRNELSSTASKNNFLSLYFTMLKENFGVCVLPSLLHIIIKNNLLSDLNRDAENNIRSIHDINPVHLVKVLKNIYKDKSKDVAIDFSKLQDILVQLKALLIVFSENIALQNNDIWKDFILSKDSPYIDDGMYREILLIIPVSAAMPHFLDTLNYVLSKNQKFDHSKKPLHIVAEYGSMQTIRSLISYIGDQIEAQDEYSKIPLHYAAQNGHVETVKLLLDNKSAIEAKGWYEKTPLHCAAQNGHVKVVKLLLERGAKIEAKDKNGKTPLHWAAEYGHVEVVELLLDRKADIEAKDEDGKTPFHYAAEDGHVEVVELLLERGAEIEAKDKDGETPLHYATKGGHVEVVELLLDRKADIEAKDEDGKTPLHYAAEDGHVEVVEGALI